MATPRLEQLEQLKVLADEDHKRVVDAIALLETYFSKTESLAASAADTHSPSKNGVAPSSRAYTKKGGTNQDKVFAVLKNGWHTMTQIREMTGLTRIQCSGVINSPKWRTLFERRESNTPGSAEKEYRMKPESESKGD